MVNYFEVWVKLATIQHMIAYKILL
jgi:hypothetical protein